MDLVCLMGLFPKNYESDILSNSIGGIQNAANNFQWALINGFDSIENVKVRIFNSIYVGSYPKRYKEIRIPNFEFEHKEGSKDINIGYTNLTGYKVFSKYTGIKKHLDKWANDGSPNKVLLAYAMTSPFVELLSYITKKYENITTVLVVPDLPEYMNVAANTKFYRKVLKKIQVCYFRSRLKEIQGYVLLTKYMEEWFNYSVKSVIIEGISSRTETEYQDANKKREKVILYAGMIEEKYGVLNMVKAFHEIKKKDWKLEIYGRGTAQKQLLEYTTKDNRIIYGGVIPNSEVIKRQEEVSVLINPRNDQEEFTKYSFPSKVIEYMGSGTPMIGYKLKGMPDEYLGKFYNVNDFNSDIKKCMEYVMECTETERIMMGLNAQKFIVSQKNAHSQCVKIVSFLEELINEKKDIVC